MNNDLTMRFQVAKMAAQGKWISIFSEVCPNEHLMWAVYNAPKHGPDPIYNGRDGFRADKDVNYRGGAYSNQGGAFLDGIAVIAFVLQITQYKALELVESSLSIDKSTIKHNPVMQSSDNNSVVRTYEIGYKEANKRKGNLNKFWSQSSRLQSCSGSERVISYLKFRGIKSDFYLGFDSLRFHPHAFLRNPSSGNLNAAPAFLQMWQTPDGTPINIHKIFLSKNSKGKLEVDNPKLMMKPTGRMTGGAVRLGLPALGALSIATGIETALSITEVTSQPCWATLNDQMLKGFTLPENEELTHLTIWADNDVPKRNSAGKLENSGVEKAMALKKRLLKEHPDMKVIVKIPPFEGWDWNDVLCKGDKKDFFSKGI